MAGEKEIATKMFVKVAFSRCRRGDVSPSPFVVVCGKFDVTPRCVDGCVCVRERGEQRQDVHTGRGKNEKRAPAASEG